MSLMKCPECEREISDRAEFCPHCGLPSQFFHIEDEKAPYTAQDMEHAESKRSANDILEDIKNTIESDEYIAESKMRALSTEYDYVVNKLKSNLYKEGKVSDSDDSSLFYSLSEKYSDLRTLVDTHNRAFIESKLTEYSDYFDTILDDIDRNIMLDMDQRIAVLTDEDYCLLVAGAGSGKTTTMAAKTRYLVDKMGVSPDDIIVISYTNKAIMELKERINQKLNIPARICTFHKFAFDLIKSNSYDSPEVNYSSYRYIFEMLEKRVFRDRNFLRTLVLFLGFYFDLPEEAFEFENLEQYHLYKARQTYQTLKSNLNEYNLRVSSLRSKKLRTITGEFMRSIQEVQIANFLYMYNIDYEYEKVYDYPIMNATKKYTPDFFIRQGENEAYLEHYGITQSHKSNILSRKQLEKYINSINTKRTVHRHYKTELIETWSGYDDGRNIMLHLREELTKRGFVLTQRDTREVYKKIVDTSKDKYVYKLIIFLMKFIELYKTNGYAEGGFDHLRSRTDNPRTLMFLDIAEKVYLHYQECLRKNNQIDFSDMINDANYLLDEIATQKKKLKYRYIIIDEFQDIARQRFNLTKKLADVTDAKVVAVGDDWQSIYAFAGSDITLFTRFRELMQGGKELKILRTYRNAQQLIDIAGGFIQKNKQQISKRLISPRNIENPVIIRSFDDTKDMWVNLAGLVENMIGDIVEKHGPKSTILLAGRYNFDLNKLINTGKFRMHGNSLKCVEHPKARLEFLTVHSAKGLGYDNVIIVNMFEGKYGFPCQIEDDPIMQLVVHGDRSIEFAEERRLFYVALTRTKNRVYICAPRNKPSRFLLEVIDDFKIPHPGDLNREGVDHFELRCPVCNYPLKYEFNKNYGLALYMCTNEPEICDFMTNDKRHRHDIYKCDRCSDGYMIVKRNKESGEPFYGCTNYQNPDNFCRHAVPIIQKV
ncbi:MAG: UvrD-helicase domain-containing protein [Clostridia bacterium]|nr:UvrD-helicase domain-containing protein [Clostridia bacterium]